MPIILIISVIWFLVGCVAVPTFEPEPYSENQLSQLETKVTNRDQLIQIMGMPDISRRDDDIWIYGKSRISGAVLGAYLYIVFIPTPYLINETQSLLIEFQEDLVYRYAVMEEKYGCYENSICLFSGWAEGEIGRYSEEELQANVAVVTSQQSDDKESKKFEEIPTSCAIYLYTTGNPWNDSPVLVSLDSTELLPIAPESYAYIVAAPGEHRLSVFKSGAPYLSKGKAEYLTSGNFTCEANSMRFMEIKYRHGQPGKSEASAIPKWAPEEEGMKEIRERSLILMP